jgi:hypothetical protein
LKLVVTEMRGLKIEKILLTKEQQAAEARKAQRGSRRGVKKKDNDNRRTTGSPATG